MVICALAMIAGLTILAAASVTAFGCGGVCGAQYSIASSAPEGAAHGFEPAAQTWPTVALPFAIPFTAHVTLVFTVPDTEALKLARWPAAIAADGGAIEIATAALLTTVTTADALCVPAAA